MAEPNNKVMTWAGWILTAFIGAMLIGFTATALIREAPEVKENLVDKFGYPESSMQPLGIVVLVCTALFLIPQTSILGAVLLTGYLGGAVATHVRAGDGNWPGAVIGGVLVWLALVLRDPRLRRLLPIRWN